MTTIKLSPIGTARACQSHRGWPIHVDTECDRLTGVVPFSRDLRCSVCDLEWLDNGTATAHDYCRDGNVGSTAIETYRRGSEDMRVIRTRRLQGNQGRDEMTTITETAIGYRTILNTNHSRMLRLWRNGDRSWVVDIICNGITETVHEYPTLWQARNAYHDLARMGAMA